MATSSVTVAKPAEPKPGNTPMAANGIRDGALTRFVTKSIDIS